MDHDHSIHYCRVCGIYHGKDIDGNDYLPWGKDGNSPSYDYCDCCGVEFGYGDDYLEAVKRSREKWLKRGNSWFAPEYKPENWSLEEQLKNIPEEYR